MTDLSELLIMLLWSNARNSSIQCLNNEVDNGDDDMGIRQTIRSLARKATGYDENLDALFYFVNHLHNVTEIPKATGDLRLLQLADAKLLKIIDLICQKNNLEYWLDSGTLIGAVRHKGFIPWDDDTDICMDRGNYLRARKILPAVCAQFGIDAKEEETCRGGWIGVGYKHKDTGIWIDIFPQSYSSMDITKPQTKKQLEGEVKIYHAKYQKRMRTNTDMNKQAVFRKKYIPSTCEKAEAKTLVALSEFWPKTILHQIDDVYPLSRIEFEGFSLYGPKNPDNYLRDEFGNYMQFPRSGILHHGEGRGPLETWARRSGTDMEQIHTELDEIIRKCKE